MSNSSSRSEETRSTIAQLCNIIERKADELSPRKWTRTFIVRLLAAVSLMIAAAVCSTLTYFVLEYQEKVLYDSQYEALVDQALDSATLDVENKFRGAKVLAETIGNINPDAAAWPNASLPGYMSIAEKVITLSSTRAIGFAPIVEVSEKESFEQYAYDVYDSDPEVPAGTGGLGIYKITPNGPVPDTTGATIYGSPNTFLTPLFQVAWPGEPNFHVKLLNLHAEPTRGTAIDAGYACAMDAEEKGSSKGEYCTTMTNFLDLVSDDTDVSTLILQPVFPANNETTITGFIVVATVWLQVLEDIFPKFVSGVDVVVENSAGGVYTYTFDKGKPRLRGKGDRHDSSYDSYKISGDLVDNLVTASESMTYKLRFYPREDFFDYYRTDLPMNGTIAVVLIMLITTIIFVIHDYVLSLESNQRQAILDTKRKFVRFISHEIRTPLNTVSLGLKLLESELKEALFIAEQKNNVDEATAGLQQTLSALGSQLKTFRSWLELTDDISMNTMNAIAVLNDLLNYDKIEMGTMQLDMKPTNMWNLCKKVVKTFEIQAKQAEVTVDIDMELYHEIPHEQRNKLCRLRVNGDELRLTQVIRNLISNALKFTPKGGSIHIVGSWNAKGLSKVKCGQILDSQENPVPRAGSMVFRFKDSGAGLSVEQLTRIFKEGVQFNAKELQAGQGSGLGLAISKGLIEQHGGTMSVSSEGLGKGCTFTIELPVVMVAEDHPSLTSLPISKRSTPNRSPRRSRSISEPRSMLRVEEFRSMSSEENNPTVVIKWNNMKILVVDDSSMNRKMLVRLLERAGHHCVQAEDGCKAIEQYNSCDPNEPYQCILMDFEMPNMKGPDATCQLREIGCKALIVGVTGNVLPEDRELFLKNGANAVLSKPLNMVELEEVWRETEWDMLSANVVANHTLSEERVEGKATDTNVEGDHSKATAAYNKRISRYAVVPDATEP